MFEDLDSKPVADVGEFQLRRLRDWGAKVAEVSLHSHVRELVNAGLLGVLVPEHTTAVNLRRDKLYRTELWGTGLSTLRPLGSCWASPRRRGSAGYTRGDAEEGLELSQAEPLDMPFNFFNYFANLVGKKPFFKLKQLK
jgi:hypothetical protein